MRSLFFVLAVGALVVGCSNSPHGTTGATSTGGSLGGSGGTNASIGTSGGSTSGTTGNVTCSQIACATSTDCAPCGSGYICVDDGIGTACCATFQAPCVTSADCCSGYACNSDRVCAVPITTTSSSASSGTSGSVTTVGATTVAAATSTGTGPTSTGTSGTTLGTSSGTTGAATSVGTTAGATTAAATSGTGTSSGATSGATGGTTTGTTTGAGGGSALALTWTFGASQACEQANVAWLSVSLDGGALSVFPCRDQNGVEGATIDTTAFAGVEADYLVTAYDGVLDAQLGQLSGSAQVPTQGTAAVPVTVPFASGQSSALDIAWTFSGLTFTQAGLATLQVDLTDPRNAAQDVSLTLDGGPNGVSLPGFGPGAYPVALTGTGSATYTASGALSANGLTPAVLLADLPVSQSGNAGNAVVNFSFGGQTCAAAGIDSVSLQLTRSNGDALAGPFNMLCGDAGTSFVFSNVPAPTTAFLWLEGLAQGQTQQLANPQIVVSPGATASYTVVAEPSP